jgi:hypothetical protein
MINPEQVYLAMRKMKGVGQAARLNYKIDYDTNNPIEKYAVIKLSSAEEERWKSKQ